MTDDRRARGAFFTPEPIAARLADAALDGRSPPRSVCDPAAGDGRLLRAVVDASSGPLETYAADLDAGAWADGPGGRLEGCRFVTGDSLAAGRSTWPDAPPGGFALVIGNPPFRSQLATATAASSAERSRLRGAYGSTVAGYTDTSALFLVAACEMAAPGGRVAMIMPVSFLTARDAAPARARVLEQASIAGIWFAGEIVFPDADVQVCALVLDRSGPRRRAVQRWIGADWSAAPVLDVDLDELGARPTWSPLIADLVDPTPAVDLPGPGQLGDLATATAGFRSQFYGLSPLVTDVDGPASGRSDGMAPMITSGAIEPGRLVWGERPSRIAGRRWTAPAIDPTGLEPGSALARWVADRRQPKVVVATQTRVVEAVADPTGEWVPSTPVIAVHPAGEDDLWRVLAVLLAPPVTAWARLHFTGAALAPSAIKLSASQVLTIPLPSEHGPWAAAAATLRDGWSADDGGCATAAVVEAATVMTAAYGADPAATGWWIERSGILGA